jgi:penicillin-binding protein 2
MAERRSPLPGAGIDLRPEGTLLVANTPVYDLMVVPRELKPFDTLAFGELIGVQSDDLRKGWWKPGLFSRTSPA